MHCCGHTPRDGSRNDEGRVWHGVGNLLRRKQQSPRVGLYIEMEAGSRMLLERARSKYQVSEKKFYWPANRLKTQAVEFYRLVQQHAHYLVLGYKYSHRALKSNAARFYDHSFNMPSGRNAQQKMTLKKGQGNEMIFPVLVRMQTCSFGNRAHNASNIWDILTTPPRRKPLTLSACKLNL